MVARILKFARFGGGLAVILSAWVVLIAVLGGSRTLYVRDAPVDVLTMVVTYVLGGLVGGALVGLMLPMAKRRVGAAVVGVVALTPAALGAGYTLAATSEGTIDFVAVAVTALVLGAAVGVGYHEIFQDPEHEEGAPRGG